MISAAVIGTLMCRRFPSQSISFAEWMFGLKHEVKFPICCLDFSFGVFTLKKLFD
ncbi:hypothetical protein Hanom_Chr10g00890321 [Helianthus anomalus]